MDPEGLLAAARVMRERLIERQAADEVRCSLSRLTIEDFQAAGFFRILQPARFDGYELPAATLFRLEIALAEADMSGGWVMANMGAAAFHAALFAAEAQAEIWEAKPEALIASANMPGGRLTPQVDGTWRLSGKWRFSSGIEHADWAVLGTLAEDGEGTVAGACLVPRDDLTVIPDWDVVGLRGTGSHAIVIQDAVVPPYRFLPHRKRFDGSAPGRAVNRAALYRLPLPQLLFRAISSASIGGLRGMLIDFLADNRERTSMMAQRIAADPHVRALCGRIDADLQACEAGMEQDFASMTASGSPGDAADLARRRAIRLNVTRIPDRCFVLAADLFRAAGSSALYRGSRVLLFLNDMLAARQHAANQYELHARNDGAVLFGEEQEDTLL